MKNVDLIIIGAGPGGYETALAAAKSGLATVLIEKSRIGGTCLNEGCIPTKCFCRSAEVMDDITTASEFGIETGKPHPDMKNIVARKYNTVKSLGESVTALLKRNAVTVISGTATFIDSHTVKVSPSDDMERPEDELVFQAPHIIIATGSSTKPLAVRGAELPGVITSKELLEIDYVPQRLCIVGGGVIGLEFASIFHAFGSQVTVLEFCKEILPNMDSDIAKRLRTTMKGKGVTVVTQARVDEITATPDGGLTVHYTHKGVSAQEVGADVVVAAVGRMANVGSLNLDTVGVAYTAKGISVNGNMQTNVPNIYAIGDINGLCQLAHAASFQGRRALHHICGKADALQLDVMPAAVFTSPEVASVGLTEEAARAQGLEIRTGKAFFRANGKALAMGAPDGLVKLIAGTDGGIIGCHILGAHAADLIQEITALMRFDATVNDLCEIVHAHPTLGEAVLDAARNMG